MADSTLGPNVEGIVLMLIFFVALPLWATVKCVAVAHRWIKGEPVSLVDKIAFVVWPCGVGGFVLVLILGWPR